jgi:bis(5'-nucleosyl)-tetraphosphatase (symmetrical)
MAIYAIGDIQGCYDPFRHLLDEIDFDADKDTLWLTGDLVNRGPKSLKTIRFVRSLGDSVITVLGNHDLHLLALATGVAEYSARFDTLRKLLDAPDLSEHVEWLRRRPLAHYDGQIDTLLVHAGVHPEWTARKTIKRAAEVEEVLRGPDFKKLLKNMYGNTPRSWSTEHSGFNRLRFIINCLTRMRMISVPTMRLNFSWSGSPFRARKNLRPWFDFAEPAWDGTRIVFGHWSALSLVVLPDLLAIDTGCVWGRQLTAVRLDRDDHSVYQVIGQR